MSIVIVALILAVLYFVILNPDLGNTYSVEEEGILFVGYGKPPADFFSEIRNSEKFVIAPQVAEEGTVNQYMGAALALFSAIISVKDKIVVSLPRVYNDSGEMLYCQTNDGNVFVNRTVDLDECNSVLGGKNPNQINILIEFPNTALPKSRVELKDYEITIKPRSYNEISRVSLVLIKVIYSDSGEIINRVNQELAKLK